MDITKKEALTILKAISLLESAFAISSKNASSRFDFLGYWDTVICAIEILEKIILSEPKVNS